jgi:hypothetical protein
MYIAKHVDLFKQIPFKQFYYGKHLFNELIALRNKNVKSEKLLECYKRIAEEVYDPHQGFIVKICLKSYDFHDNITYTEDSICQRRYKKPKLFNGVLNKKGYCNRKPQRPNGLVITPKHGVPKREIEHLIEDFVLYSYLYQPHRDPFTHEIQEVSIDKIDCLYTLLEELLEKSDFQYIPKGSIILAREMAENLTHQYIAKYTLNQIKCGHDHDFMIEWYKQHKQLMFGEIRHTYNMHR